MLTAIPWEGRVGARSPHQIENTLEEFMKSFSAVALGLLVFCFVSVSVPSSAAAQGSGWTTLFDGSSLAAFDAIGDANWELADGIVSADSGSGFLVTKSSWGNFEMTLEFWVDEPANSGIFIRCADPSTVRDTNSYEVNIYDTRADQTYRTGGIVHIAAPASVINSGGHWNSYRIRAEGSRLRVTLNGIETVDARDDQFAQGPIALQYAAGTVRFRNVLVRSLD